MPRAPFIAGAPLLLALLAGCASPTDPTTDKVYYTGGGIATRYRESGAIRFEDARTGRIVTLTNHVIRPLTRAEFNAAVNETAVPTDDRP